MGSIHRINRTLNLGKGAESVLWLDILVDGKLVHSKRADSFLGNFIADLFVFHWGHFPRPGQYEAFDKCVGAYAGNSDNIDNNDRAITDITTGSPARVTAVNHGVTAATDTIGGYGRDFVQLMNIRGATNLHGLFKAGYVNGTQFDLYDLAGNPVQADNTPVLTNNPRMRLLRKLWQEDPNNFDTSFLTGRPYSPLLPQIRVGAGTATNAIDMQCLDDEYLDGTGAGSLVHSTVTVNTPAIVTGTPDYSTITISRDITNQSGGTLAINEIGLYVRSWQYSTARYFRLWARDLAALNVPHGSTITINYRLRTTSVQAGGIMIPFNEVLYRNLAGATREAKDLYNVNQSNTYEPASWWMGAAIGGNGRGLTGDYDISYHDEVGGTGYGYPGYMVGPLCGPSTQDVSHTDFSLVTTGVPQLFPHGIGSGKLFYYGTTVDELEFSGNYARYKISKMVENRSGGDITINDMGLAMGYGSTYPYMWARHKVSPGVVLADGDAARLEYTVECNV